MPEPLVELDEELQAAIMPPPATQAATRAPLSLFLPLSVLHLLVEIAFVIQHSNPRSGGDQEPSRRGRRRALSPSLRTWPISSKTLPESQASSVPLQWSASQPNAPSSSRWSISSPLI